MQLDMPFNSIDCVIDAGGFNCLVQSSYLKERSPRVPRTSLHGNVAYGHLIICHII